MNDVLKNEMRNYLQGAGFFLIAFLVILPLIAGFASPAVSPILFSLAVSLFLIGILLVILRKRDLSAMLFMLFGASFVFISLSGVMHGQMFFVFILITALILLTAQDTVKYLFSLLLVLGGVGGLVIEFSPTLSFMFAIVEGVLALYYAFACMSERLLLPGRGLITADNETDFKASGSVLGYLFFGLAAANWAFVPFLGTPAEAATALEAVSGFMMILSGILLLTVGKMRFTPVMFILLGAILSITQYCSGSMFYAVSAMMIILGLFCLLRNERRVLPAVMLIVYACTAIAASLGLIALSGVLDVIAALIAVYVAFAVFSQRKIPLF